MNISLTDELENFVFDAVKSGMYHSNSEVIRDGLRLLKRLNHSSMEYKTWLNQHIQKGLNDIENGRVVDGETSFNRMKKRLQERTNEL
jgi:antitoxin ParD1/3/4